jgi:hypothetical protein
MLSFMVFGVSGSEGQRLLDPLPEDTLEVIRVVGLEQVGFAGQMIVPQA